jgi:alcohol dehydrogenase class IV
MSVSQAQPWWEFATAARISFGRDVSRFLPDAADSLGRRVLVITDPALVAAGVTEPLVAALRGRQGTDLLVWDQGEPEIGMRRAEECAAVVRGFEPSVVVAVGGGSTMDLAKVVAARLLAGSAINDWPERGAPERALPVIALPTTAGTGSEVTSVAVLTDEARNVKVGLTSAAFLPRVVLVDPLLTLSCPPHVTAHSGMDALSHALEAYLALGFDQRSPVPFAQTGFCGKNPVSDALALPAVALIGDNLPRAVADGGDVAARESMALASLLAGMAFAKAGTGIVHALQYPVGAATKTPHGLGNAVLMPSAVRFNLPSRWREAAAVARALGCDATDDAEAAGQLPGLLTALARSVGIEPGLDRLGVTEADLTGFAAAAAGITRLTQNNPRPVDAQALYGVLRDALHAAS